MSVGGPSVWMSWRMEGICIAPNALSRVAMSGGTGTRLEMVLWYRVVLTLPEGPRAESCAGGEESIRLT
ncbi:hypothetical protein IAQ61_010484 [Plenodomus lingam]|uniref:uncharacterized protein n=1 Tax=Leptosphaeria maculans TaxID=5022 RepID=UPI0033345709|nr:hypothetical protein IAQ61_010484 [Plenodomus lingam]